MKRDTKWDSHVPLYHDKVMNNMGQSVTDGCLHHTHTHTYTHVRAHTHFKTLLGEDKGSFGFFPEKSLTVERVSADCSETLFSDPPAPHPPLLSLPI